MRQFVITMAGVLAGLTLFFVAIPFLFFVWLAAAAGSRTHAAGPEVLALDLRQTLTDQDSQNPLAALTGGRGLSVMGITSTLKRAARDPDVKGLLVRLPEGGIAPAAADEIAAAIRGFRAAGKPVIAHSQGIYPTGMPVSSYVLGAASGGGFWMQPGASLQATGAVASELFFKRAFDKYGVQADYQQRYQYKTAVNPYLYSDYTPAHREEELGWMTSVYGSEIAEAAADRHLAPAALKSALEAGPYLADDARARGLVDRLGDELDAETALKRAAGPGVGLKDFAAYALSAADRARRGAGGPAVAVIGAEGDIQTGTARRSGLSGSSGIYSDDVARAFRDAARDSQVKAIVFRVSSPGGSDTASEQIGAALAAARAAGKPVVVSMGTYAASGGYWVSAGADEIVAQPTTLTGSIGVFGGKFVTGPALARFGLDERRLSVGGDYASAFATDAPFTPAQRAAVSAWMDRIYAGFVGHVAAGRRLAPARVGEIARGRVWTGEQAKGLGLVDRLGGFDVALAEARRLGGLGGAGEVTLKTFPTQHSPLKALARLFGAQSRTAAALASLDALAEAPQARAALALADRARLAETHADAVLAPVPQF